MGVGVGVGVGVGDDFDSGKSLNKWKSSSNFGTSSKQEDLN